MSKNNERNGALKKSQRESKKQKANGTAQKSVEIEQNLRHPKQPDGENESGDDAEQPQHVGLSTYDQAQQYCMNQLNAIRQKELAAGKSQVEIDKTLKEAELQCEQFLDQFNVVQNQTLAAQNGLYGSHLHSQQQHHSQSEVVGMDGQLEEELREEDSDFSKEMNENNEAQQALLNEPNPLNNPYPLNGLGNMQSMLQQQQAAMLLSQMSQNPEELIQNQQKLVQQQMKKQMGNQLRLFAKQMFQILPQRQKKKLDKESKQYLDQCMKDQKKLQKRKSSNHNNQNDLNDNDQMEIELQADPKKYLEEIETTLKKHNDLKDNFQRFKHLVFDDIEQEQVITNFIIINPHVHKIYIDFILCYNIYHSREQFQNVDQIGDQIFNLIMPFAQQYDPRLVTLIPQLTLQKFEITYEDDGFHIKSWEHIDNMEDEDEGESSGSFSGDESSESQQSDDEDSESENSSSQISGPQSLLKISSNDDIEGSVPPSNLQTPKNHKSEISGWGRSQITDNIDIDPSGDITQPIGKGGKNKNKTRIEPIVPQLNGMNPNNQYLTGKNKSLINQFNFTFPNQKNINRNELRPLENLFKSTKEEKDWSTFCKMLFLYFEGVTSISELILLFDDKFQTKLKQDTKDEIIKLLPTRDQNRRFLSNLLKAWNDTENQTFEKIPNSSYYRIDVTFPLPSCFRRQQDPVYWKNLNDRYLSLATGSENQKFRNINEEAIYKTEDKLYMIDTQIDNIERSQKIIQQQCQYFNKLSEEEQGNYKFPVAKLSPLKHYWDQKFRRSMQEQYLKEGKQLKLKELKAFENAIKEKLDYLMNHKKMSQHENKETLRKNFAKSLDHKSFQFKDFMRRYLQKLNHIQRIKQTTEENAFKVRHLETELNVLCGSGGQAQRSDYMFMNTFGKEFVGTFDQKRVAALDKVPDHPIDMKFMNKLKSEASETVHANQSKCPQARFLMNDRLAFDITLKLVIQNIKYQCNNQSRPQFADESKLMNSLKFIIERFLMYTNFDQMIEASEEIKVLDSRRVEILLNSATYYQMKYDGTLEHMQEIFPIEGMQGDLSLIQSSPLKINSQDIKQNNQLLSPEQLNIKNSKSGQIKSNEALDDKSSFEEIVLEKGGKSNMSVSRSNKSSDSDPDEFNQSLDQLSEPSRVSSVRPDANPPFKKLRLSDEKMQSQSVNDIEMLEKEITDSLFVPRFVQNKKLDDDKQYKLLYGPTNIYMFITFFYSVYERILKAQELVKFKVEQDFRDDFSKREWSLKFESKKQCLIDERFQYLVKAILTTMYQSNVLDTNKYEDVARELLGNEAYLLFQADRLVNHCTKHLAHLQTDASYKLSKKLYKKFEIAETKNESTYLANFYQAANICSQNTLQNAHSGNKAHGGGNPATGAAAVNKDPLINLQSFRLMYSPISKILTVHFVVLNPFYLQEVRVRRDGHAPPAYPFRNTNGDINQDEYLESLLHHTRGRETRFYDSDSEEEQIYNSSQQEEIHVNKAASYTQAVFLKRNLRKMKALRKKPEQRKRIRQSNGLKSHMIPLIKQIQFETNTEDMLEYKRKETGKNEKLLGQRQAKDDLKFQLLAKKVLQKRLKQIEEAGSDSELFKAGGDTQNQLDDNLGDIQ